MPDLLPGGAPPNACPVKREPTVPPQVSKPPSRFIFHSFFFHVDRSQPQAHQLYDLAEGVNLKVDPFSFHFKEGMPKPRTRAVP
eukprot:1157018-Pelagomonas_calceolata.AAC.5